MSIEVHLPSRTREDTVRCIVASLTDDSSNDLADVSYSHSANLHVHVYIHVHDTHSSTYVIGHGI